MSDTVSTILILAVVAMFEGVRRVAPDAFVLRRVLLGRWRAVEPLDLGRGWSLAAWPIPAVMALVMDDRGDVARLAPARQPTRLRARLRRSRTAIAVLRILGAIILLTLVAGVPLATLRWDVWGLAMSLEVLLLLCVVQAIVTYMGQRRAGGPPRSSLWPAIRALWPFAAPRAAEWVLERATAGTSALVVCGELLGRDALLLALRPRVYDELHSRGTSSGVVSFYGREAVAGFLRTPPGGKSEPFCPRCGSGYRADVSECSDCGGVPVIAP